MKKHLPISSLLTLILGTLIYILFRAPTLKVFSWLDSIRVYKYVKLLRELTYDVNNNVPVWLKDSLPDGLWVYSYICMILYIWKGTIDKSNILWLLILPTIAIGSEIMQKFSLLKGTYDFTDIVFYSIGTITPFILYKKHLTFKYYPQ